MVAVFADRHVEAPGYAGGDVNIVHKHKPVAFDSRLRSLALCPAAADSSSLSVAKKDNFFR